ncbi:COMM domain-containing protein 7 isoform X2 [Ornithorhynchus anatinus]|uniref:COMM domain-containing protein 7 isoform X2 n=1 Tax=Ornithorhynchus anatinus TaxID=9258 RepID=UPI0010A824C4|nr:COMM domain-containing protein 7 isoform X2 [Ornithorhynchus anatinus]
MAPLHFSREPVPESVGGDVHSLNQLGLEFSALTDVVFRLLLEPGEVERFLGQLSELALAHQLGLGHLKSLTKTLLLVPQGALKKNMTAEQIREDWITLGLTEEKAKCFADKWQRLGPSLARLAAGRTLAVNQLVDMEWKFGVTAGSSELQKTGNIFLQLKLVVKKGNRAEPLYIELTLPQFYSFLHEMERARASLECFG